MQYLSVAVYATLLGELLNVLIGNKPHQLLYTHFVVFKGAHKLII